MDHSKLKDDRNDMHRKTASAYSKLLALLADIAPQEPTSAERSQDEDISNSFDTQYGTREKLQEDLGNQITRSAMREWTENRLADLRLWINGTGVLARSEASLDTRLSSHRAVKAVIASLLMILESSIDICRTFATSDGTKQIVDGREGVASPDEYSSDSSAGDLSPWSDEDSEHHVVVDNNPTTGHKRKNVLEIGAATSRTRPYTSTTPSNDLSVSMRQVESTLSQLIRLGFKIRQSANKERFRKADATLATRDHEVFRKHLIFMLSVPKNGIRATVDVYTNLPTDDHYSEGLLNKVQIRLIDLNLRRRNRFMYAWNHTKSLAPQRPADQTGFTNDITPAVAVSRGTNVDRSSKAHTEPSKPTTSKEPSRISGVSGIGSQLLRLPERLAGPVNPESTHVSTITGKMDYPKPPFAVRSERLGFKCPCCAQVLPKTVGTSLRQWSALRECTICSISEEHPRSQPYSSSFALLLHEPSTSSTTKKQFDGGAVTVFSSEKHIARDILPYVCPIGDCDAPDVLYCSAEDWKSHLYEKHTRGIQWLCPACGAKTDTSDEFIEHILGNHKNVIDPDLIEDFADTCRQHELVPVSCPICVDGSDCSLDLIGEHIHGFSLLSLPWPVTDPPPDELMPFQRSELPISENEYFADEGETEASDAEKDHETDRFDGLEPFNNGHAELTVEQIYQMLRPADPSENHRKAINLKHTDTGSWFLESDSFLDYKKGVTRDLILFGGPGSGKTILSSTIIAELERNTDLLTLYYYFSVAVRTQQTGTNMLRSLIYQLVCKQRNLVHILGEYHERGDPTDDEAERIELGAIWSHMVLSCDQEVRIVLDALDECTDPEDVLECLEADSRSDRLHVIITSRYSTRLQIMFDRKGYEDHLNIDGGVIWTCGHYKTGQPHMKPTRSLDKCKICQKIDTKLRRRAAEKVKIQRWESEGSTLKASIERSYEIVRDLDQEIHQLEIERQRKYPEMGKH